MANIRSKLKKMDSFAETKNSNNNSIQSSDSEMQNYGNFNSKINYYPVLLKQK